LDDVRVTVYRGEGDGRRVVHVDIFEHVGPIRVDLNDGRAVYHVDPATGRCSPKTPNSDHTTSREPKLQGAQRK
jgi:hypothetical protein